MRKKMEQALLEKKDAIEKLQTTPFEDLDVFQKMKENGEKGMESVVTKGNVDIKKSMQTMHDGTFEFLNSILQDVHQTTQQYKALNVMKG